MKKLTEEKLKSAVANSISVAEALRKMDMNVSTGNYKSFHKSIKLYNVDTSHFLGQSHLSGKSHDIKTTIPLNEILVENSTCLGIAQLKKRMMREGLIKYECYECGLSTWRGKKISLQLDHINGTHNDHRIENLRLLCPNCHSQTETFAGKNKTPADKALFVCKCGKTKRRESETCRTCAANKREKIIWPPFDELLVMVKNQGYTEISKKLGVSRTSIKKKLTYDPKYLNTNSGVQKFFDDMIEEINVERDVGVKPTLTGF